MKLTSVALFGAGYVLGSRAGRERYQEIVALVGKATQGLERKSARDRILEYANDGTSLTEVFRFASSAGDGRANGTTRSSVHRSPGQASR